MAAPKILLVHGAWHGGWCWEDNWLPYLEDLDFDVSIIELHDPPEPGSRHRIWTRMASYVDRVRRELDRLGPDTVVVGHSMGGLIVQRALEESTARGMVLIASVPHVGVIPATLRTLRRIPRQTLATIATLNMWCIVGTGDLTRSAFFSDDSPADTVEATHQRLQNESYTAYVSMMVRPSRPSSIRTPTLVIAAERDALFTVHEQAALADKYSTEAAVVPGAGHDLMLDTQWRQAADLVVDWINQLDD